MAISRRLVRFVVVGAIGAVVLVVTPVLGALDDPKFGAPELRAAVEGTWQLTFTAPPEGDVQTVTFRLIQGSKVQHADASRTLVRSAAACGTRTLVKNAGACASLTRMPIDVMLAAGPKREPGIGEIRVEGDQFDVGWLEAPLGDLTVVALVRPDGKTEKVSVQTADHGLPARLTRIAR